MNLLQRSVRTKTSRHHRTLGLPFFLFVGRFLQPYDAGILDILRANYGAARNEVKHENGPFWQLGKMAFHCPRCNAGYTYKKTLKTHMKYDCGKEPRCTAVGLEQLNASEQLYLPEVQRGFPEDVGSD
ncbi:hypothetical protein HN011_005720 [Eciton burchellii]|nr:hypothetical protein HN011_005720 [Eciton burchellii]